MRKEVSDGWEFLKMANNFNEGKKKAEETNMSRNIHVKWGIFKAEMKWSRKKLRTPQKLYTSEL